MSNFMLLGPSEFLLNIKRDYCIPLGVPYNFKRVFQVFDILVPNIKNRLIYKENITINRLSLSLTFEAEKHKIY